MSPKRHSDDDHIVVRSLGLRLTSGHRIESHAHEWHQLIYATDGVMSVGTTVGSWVVPSHRAVWIPASCEHTVSTTGRVRMQTVYIRPGFRVDLHDTCCVINVTPLLRELILETMRLGMLDAGEPMQHRLALLILDQIKRTHVAALQLTIPSDARARSVARRVQADLSVVPSLADLARGSGASVRTIERLFVSETGMTFGRWLQRVRAMHALERLAVGDSVVEAGLAVGYDSTSAFIAMFKRVLGRTPGSYFAAGA